jgi:delta(3,5)-delta(2,4)-dienoyl-CoA isomerase
MSKQSSTDISLAYKHYTTLAVTSPAQYILQVELNRPAKRNAMNDVFWKETVACFEQIKHDTANDIRVVIISGAGVMFTAGLDLQDKSTASMFAPSSDAARKGLEIRQRILQLQRSFSILEELSQPVIAAVHGLCVGGGIDMITACDIRVCTADAQFTVKEVDIALAADLGTLQRLPRVVGNLSWVNEVSLTARLFSAEEALRVGLVSSIYKDKAAMIQAAIATATTIANKSPIATAGTKHILLKSRDLTVQQGLEYVATYNSGQLQTDDLLQAIQSSLSKTKPVFSKL